MPRQTYAAFARELAQQDAAMARIFLELVASIASGAQAAALDEAIAARDINQVWTVLRLDAGFWAPLDRQVQEAFIAGATWQQSLLPRRQAPQLRISFNHRNARAERWYMSEGARLVAEITEDQRTMVRVAVLGGLEQGRGVRSLRRELIGERVGNQRKGGIVGLHSREAAAVRNMRGYLSDPETAAEYFQRTARDRRFDGTVRKAARDGTPLTETQIDRITQAYAQRLLVKRSDRIARTEMHNAFTAGNWEGLQQVMEANNIPPDAVTLTWQATIGSARTRDSHRAMNGQKVSVGEAFVSPVTGARMLRPGDDSLGAPGSETINCRCSALPRIDFARLAV